MSSIDLIHTVEGIALLYTSVYLLLNLGLIIAGARPVLDQVRERGFLDLDLLDERDSTAPRIAIVVPAFNEATTIVETVTSLMGIDYPDLELVIVNDGSTDATRLRMCRAFGMHRRDLARRSEIATAPIRAVYEATRGLPAHVSRFVMVDKENGGRADALNAGIDVCLSPVLLTVDADCLVDSQALKHLMRILQSDPGIAAVGGQVGVVNESTVSGGRVVEARVPRRFVPLCQTIEYLRAFSVMRTGFSRLGSLLIVSGAFMLIRREIAVDVGGFLTGRSPSRLLGEYVGPGRSTICEDMELIVRIHRHLRERGDRGRVVHAPVPLVWTEVPPTLASLAKQRRRWHRGLLEILWMHRAMILDPRYGRIGLFAMPYFVWFEALGPWIESIGLFLIPLLAIAGLLDPLHAALITGIALGAGVLQSLSAVLVTTWMEPTSLGGRQLRSLLGADRWRDRLRLVAGAFLTELGYRQLTVFWRIRATFEFLRGYDGWDKFERAGFQPEPPRAAPLPPMLLPILLPMLLPLALVLSSIALHTPAAQAAADDSSRRVTAVFGIEERDGDWPSWWTEMIAQWSHARGRTLWAGTTSVEREGHTDTGVILGYSPERAGWGGFGVEGRLAPGARFSPRAVLSAETEFRVAWRATGSLRLRESLHANLRVTSLMAGGVVYLPRSWWWSNHAVILRTRFDGTEDTYMVGLATQLNVEEFGARARVHLARSGESFLVENLREPRDIRAVVAGASVGIPVAGIGEILAGVDRRIPERGSASFYLHLGLRRGF